ncbi:MAG: transcriptional regulator [Vicinamibacterales bacterium]
MSPSPHDRSADPGGIHVAGFSFGPFTLDLRRHALVKGHSEIRLRPKTFDVVACLLRNAGRLRFWPMSTRRLPRPSARCASFFDPLRSDPRFQAIAHTVNVGGR